MRGMYEIESEVGDGYVVGSGLGGGAPNLLDHFLHNFDSKRELTLIKHLDHVLLLSLSAY